MARQEPEQRHDKRPEQLTDAEIAADMRRFPDREAMSLVSPAGGLGAGAGWTYVPGPLPHDTPPPAEPTTGRL